MAENSEKAKGYFGLGDGHSELSAAAIVPIVVEAFWPESVIDVGCGTGVWLREFQRRGVRTIKGIDADWVPEGQRHIPDSCFEVRDLREPLRIGQRFDLAMSVEVAEHLPEERSDSFVEQLTRLSDVVLFSAAVPGQGGYQHINEQWQPYWMERFKQREFEVVDLVRPHVWNDPAVSFWYKQNLFLYVARSRADVLAKLRGAAAAAGPMLNVVHPELYLRRLGPDQHTAKTLVEAFQYLARHALKIRF